MSVLNQTLTSNSNSGTLRSGALYSRGGFNTLYASGAFDGGTLQVQASPDNGTNWFDVTGANLTADGVVNFEIKAELLRVNLSGASSPNVEIWVL
jgi:hypothetical protein